MVGLRAKSTWLVCLNLDINSLNDDSTLVQIESANNRIFNIVTEIM